jgi:mannose-6-phosphate isomerase-like protein (cupin superfamily)
MTAERRARVVGPGEHLPEHGPAPGVTAATMLDGRHGCTGLRQRRVRFAAGAEAAGSAGPRGESWYVVSGDGSLAAGTDSAGLRAGTAFWLRRGTGYRVRAGTGLQVVVTEVRAGEPGEDAGPPLRLRALADCEPERTGDREFRVLLSSGPLGRLAITQFVGVIPPGRAPAHQHGYDEVVYVLDGEGVAHLAGADARISAQTSVYLPPLQLHCLENTGAGPLRVLGVFYPAGSPAAKAPARHDHHHEP